MLARANVNSAAVSERTACPGSDTTSVRRKCAKARRMSHSAPKPTTTSIVRIPITRPGLPEFTSRETTPPHSTTPAGRGARRQRAPRGEREQPPPSSRLRRRAALQSVPRRLRGFFPRATPSRPGQTGDRNCRAFSGGSSAGAVCANDVTETQKKSSVTSDSKASRAGGTILIECSRQTGRSVRILARLMLVIGATLFGSPGSG